MHARQRYLLLTLAVLGAACRRDATHPQAPDTSSIASAADQGSGHSVIAFMYAADFVATAATGVAMNDAGHVTGTSYPDPGCGPFCLPPLEAVVWRGTNRIVLPPIPGRSDIHVRDINNQGWVAGLGGDPGTDSHAALWRPSGPGYTAIDLGTLPGTTISEAAGVDDQGRVVGWSTTTGFPFNGSPFMWSQSTGMIDLSTRGFPDDIPLAISPGGTVATPDFWYRLVDPGSVVPMPPPPNGFFPPGTHPTRINDAGDQARFLVSNSGRLRYPFRFNHAGTWQQISNAGTGNLAVYDFGGITLARDIVGTVQSTGVAAPGPNGVAQPLAPRLSRAYGGAAITRAEDINSAGTILAHVMIGRSARLMRLVPVTPCAGNCIRVSQLTMTGTFVDDPLNPGRCVQGGPAHNLVTARVTVTNEAGARLAGVRVKGRFLDDYWTNRPVAGTTNAQGIVQFTIKGPCGVGAVAFLVDEATASGRRFDRTMGILTRFVIPQ
jgi:probable HAF family extracellular repeat protein